MTAIKTIIIDDEPKAIDVLNRYCNETELVEVVATFRDPIKALEFLQTQSVHLLFLDINMPKISGMEFLNILKIKPKVIFTTAYSEYAVDSFDYDTVDYLLKPIEFQRFMKAVAKVRNLIASNDSSSNTLTERNATEKIIYIKSGPKLYKIDVADILYLEKDGNYLIFHTKDKKILSRQNMKDVFEIVSPKEFLRVHKSYIVAIKHMEIIESHQIKICNIKIPVGRNYREELMKIANL
ncbi:LytTR family DNA-binding domain-containing protein [Flavobacteriaceae bacterium F89]|uniref:LytTR family DNA-binding domain-containing protein n=1 Tax=Cerina litoralis TaxID=2874477 RepID=A0AAE3EUB9_9FLAO|nr:LytTR family DNA-binding domain-containing protein [Cerina litoralis]MCG2459771.1 LytTR family DNA-binding domain-containing protein [Cerina litoralis]